MRMQSITGLASVIVLGTALASIAQLIQRDAGHGRLLAQEDIAENMTQERRQNEGGDRDLDASFPVRNQPRSAADILGMDILSTTDDEKIGEVKDTIIDMESGRILAVVVSTGGFLDMDRQLSLISPKDLRFDSDGENLRSDLSRGQIRSAPRLTSDDVAGFAGVPRIGSVPESSNSEVQERAEHREVNQATQTDQTEGGLVNDGEPGELRRHERGEDRKEPESRDDPTDGRSTSSGKGLMVSDLVGMNLENPRGESISAVEKVYLDLEQGVAIGVVVSTGGFLGLGDRKTLLGLNDLVYNSDEEVLIVDFNKEQLGEVPEYKEDEPAAFDALRERMERLEPSSQGL